MRSPISHVRIVTQFGGFLPSHGKPLTGMSIGVKFPTDIFISYARRDNVSVSGPEGWITALHIRLLQMLAERTGKQPQIWRDPQVEGNEILEATIVLKLKESAILLSVVSPLYMESLSLIHISEPTRH